MRFNHTLTGCALILATILSGCSTAEETPTANPPVSAASQWDPESWKPHSTFKRPQYTEQQKLQSRQYWLDQYIRQGAEAKDIPIVRWVTHIEFAELMVSELERHGFGAVADENGQIHFVPGVPESQEKLLDQVYYDTYSRYPVDPVYASDYSREQLGMLWDYWTEYYVPCMTAQGFKVEHSPVSRETFISSFFLPGTEHWWPSNASSMPNLDAQLELERICPPPLPIQRFCSAKST